MRLAMMGRLSAGEDLTFEEMGSAMDQIMQGLWSDQELAVFLTALHHKGETPAEIAGAASALRKHMTPIRSPYPLLLDTCGTGGDGSHTFNISTAAALVTAAAGVPVAKHGNRGMTSSSGSADVLAELGVNIQATVAQAEFCLAQTGICFCFAPLLHGAMKHVSAVRRQLGFRTIFNLLGPLGNPARATHQLLGVGQPALRPLLAQALQQLETHRSLIVCGRDGLDEVTLRGPTDCTEIQASSSRDFSWEPADFGLSVAHDFSPILINGPADSAALIRQVLANQPGLAREMVVVNAAAALWVAGKGSPRDCVGQVSEAIASGAAKGRLDALIECSHASLEPN